VPFDFQAPVGMWVLEITALDNAGVLRSGLARLLPELGIPERLLNFAIPVN
jgi:hypothetical protein